MNKFEGKKILILGGADIHVKLVNAAKELGVYTIVTDYLVDSPAKKIADKSYMLNIFDVDEIVEMCREEKVDAVLSTSLDPCQRPYQEICERLDLPCYCTREQVFKLTDKDAFKACCIENGVDIIPTYDITGMSLEEIKRQIPLPVLVKPSHCRGSRGQSICYTADALVKAVKLARQVSDNGNAIIEKYMGNHNDFTMTYLFVDGEAHLIKIADRFLGTVESGMDRLAIATVSPSRYTDMYMKNVHQRVVNMLKSIGIKNGPVFMQGFVDGNTVRFYDPGFRFPGAEYETMIKHVWGIDVMKMMVEFALTGKFSESFGRLHDDVPLMKGKAVGMLLPTIREGEIKKIKGLDQIEKLPELICYTVRHKSGDVITKTNDVNQLLSEFNVVCDNLHEYKRVLKKIQELLEVTDINGENMLCSVFDVEEMQEYAFGKE